MATTNRLVFTLDEVRAAVRACGPFFYHATTAAAYEQIRQHGLLPDHVTGAVSGVADRPLLCYSLQCARGKWLRKMQTRYDGAAVVLLELPAIAFREKEVAIDFTSTEWLWYYQLGRTTALSLVQSGIDIVCFDPIEAKYITVATTLPARPARECLGAERDLL